MKEVKLLPHNEEAYQKLINCLEKNQMVSINHATGTGKSFIILKYISENPNKKILYLAPTYPILEQLLNEHAEELEMESIKNVDTLIYRTLLSMNMSSVADEYDVIVLDEYHRCGAKKWGNKVNELIEIVKEKYPNKKIIGTTATEIRYLDNNKNMKNILFDGVEASRLELADAILKGILPAPTYIALNYNLLSELDILEKRINRLVNNQEEKRKSLLEILKLKREVEGLFKIDYLNEYLKPPGKYLVFSSNINQISEDKEKIQKIFGNEDIGSYEIHSHKKREANKKILNEFRNNDKSKTSILYSVDILNEGVHVKDIDSIFMLRSTTSPIIYFQQLGRLLSYSSRKDEVVVFDLVNNLKNNPAIYELYNDLIDKAKNLIISDPENKNRYEAIIKNFKIINVSGNLYTQLDNLKREYSVNNLIYKNMEYAIDTLENNLSNEIDKIQANLIMFKYQDYITIDLFKRIKQIDQIEKPNIFNFSVDEFTNYLNGASCIKEKNGNMIEYLFEKLKKFFEYNGSLPSVLSNNVDEIELANLIFEKINSFKQDQKEYILEKINDDLNLFEKISYGYKADDINYDVLSNDLNDIFNTRIYINLNVSELIRKRLLIYNKNGIAIKEIDNVYKNLTRRILNDIYNHNTEIEMSENIFLNEKESQNKISDTKKIDQIKFQEFFCKVANECNDIMKEKNIDEILNELYETIKQFIIINKREPKYHEISTKNLNNDEKTIRKIYESKLFCKKAFFKKELEEKGYLKELDEFYLNTITNYNDEIYMNDIVEFLDFMNEHGGAMPSINNPDYEEQKLARKYINHKKNYSEKLNTILLEEINTNLENRNEIFKKYITFITNNRRKPLKVSLGEEKDLFLYFNRWYPYLTKEQLMMLKKTLSSISTREQMKNVYEMLKNRKK